MCRLARHLLTLCSATSLLLCVVVCVLWARSYRLGSFGEFIGSLHTRTAAPAYHYSCAGIYSSHGSLGVGFMHQVTSVNDPWQVIYPDGRRLVWDGRECFERYPFMSMPRPTALNEWGFCARWASWPIGSALVTARHWSRGIAVPHWLVAFSAAILPAVHARRVWRPMRQRQRGHCVRCGYDLRASPDRCPECGTPAKYRRRRHIARLNRIPARLHSPRLLVQYDEIRGTNCRAS
jgi:hypothetical protein